MLKMNSASFSLSADRERGGVRRRYNIIFFGFTAVVNSSRAIQNQCRIKTDEKRWGLWKGASKKKKKKSALLL